MSRSVLVLGGAGFIGSNITARFVKAGWSVTVIDGFLKKTGGKKENLETVLSDINFNNAPIQDVEILDDLIQTSDLIIDCMAWTSHNSALENPEYDVALNILSHLPLLKGLRKYPGKNVIFLGSRSQYGNPGCDTITEDTPMVPGDVHGIDKLAGELYFQTFSKLYGFNVVSLRVGNCFGEHQPVRGDDIGLVGSFIHDALTGTPITIFGTDRKRSIMYVKDLADVILRLSEVPFKGFAAYNICTWNIAIKHIAEVIIESAGRGELLVKEIPEHLKHTDMGSATFDCTGITRLIGEIPESDVQTAFRNTVAYFRTQLHL